MPECCEKCRFYVRLQPAAGKIAAPGIVGAGECRYAPPVLHDHELFARFPQVTDDMWCGRFEART